MLQFFKNLDFSSLSESFRKDAKSAFIVVLMLACMYFIHGKSECQEKIINNNERYLEQRLEDSKYFREQIIKEVRRQVTPMIQTQIEEKTQEIKAKVDTVGENIKYLTETLKHSL